MSPQFIKWKSDMDRTTECIREFERWLFIHISGILLADKAGELLSLNAGQFGLGVEAQIIRIKDLSSIWNYSCIVLCPGHSCARIIIYNPGMVKRALSEMPPWALNGMGYSHDVTPNDFLKEIGRRWRERREIPHEIGLALGYPVKDVLGYMGLVSLPHTGSCGWRIHGDPRPSLWTSRRYELARQRAEAFLQDQCVCGLNDSQGKERLPSP